MKPQAPNLKRKPDRAGVFIKTRNRPHRRSADLQSAVSPIWNRQKVQKRNAHSLDDGPHWRSADLQSAVSPICNRQSVQKPNAHGLSRKHSMRNRSKLRKQRLGLGFGPHARPLPPSLFGEENRARRNPMLPCHSPSVLSVISCSTALLRLGDGPQNTILRYGRLKICATTYEISGLAGLNASSIQQDCQGRVKPGQTWSNLKFFPNRNLDRTGRVSNRRKQRKQSRFSSLFSPLPRAGSTNVAAAMRRRTFMAASSASSRRRLRLEMSIGTSLTTVVNCELISVCT